MEKMKQKKTIEKRAQRKSKEKFEQQGHAADWEIKLFSMNTFSQKTSSKQESSVASQMEKRASDVPSFLCHWN